MTAPSDTAGLIAAANPIMGETFEQVGCGDAHWATLFSADRTPSSSMCAGIMTLRASGGHLMLHSHKQSELYHVLFGTGVLRLSGVDHHITAGQTVFIPGDAEHGLRNDGSDELRIFYVFPTDRFSDVYYRFSDT